LTWIAFLKGRVAVGAFLLHTIIIHAVFADAAVQQQHFFFFHHDPPTKKPRMASTAPDTTIPSIVDAMASGKDNIADEKKNETPAATAAVERLPLPVDEFESTILERIQKNRVTVIQGETGCGTSVLFK
jgi:HrpA-like RNA helicase